MHPLVILLDNRDSFVHNIARYLRELGARTEVVRSDRITLDELEKLAFEPSGHAGGAAPEPRRCLVISPGPCTPREAGVSVEAVRRFAGRLPILGVCLGHQCIVEAFGGRIGPAIHPMHGRAVPIEHEGRGVFAGLPSPLQVGRYHSLATPAADLPARLRIMARAPDGEVMAVEDVEAQVVGLQFHPESILTEHGHQLLENFLRMGDGRATAPVREPGGLPGTVR